VIPLSRCPPLLLSFARRQLCSMLLLCRLFCMYPFSCCFAVSALVLSLAYVWVLFFFSVILCLCVFPQLLSGGPQLSRQTQCQNLVTGTKASAHMLVCVLYLCSAGVSSCRPPALTAVACLALAPFGVLPWQVGVSSGLCALARCLLFCRLHRCALCCSPWFFSCAPHCALSCVQCSQSSAPLSLRDQLLAVSPVMCSTVSCLRCSCGVPVVSS